MINHNNCMRSFKDGMVFNSTDFYRLFEEKGGIGLPLMEELNAESELSLRFGLWGIRKSHSEIFIYICAKFCNIHFDGKI